MTQYRGKHSRNHDDNSNTNENPGVSRLQPEKSDDRRFAPVSPRKGDAPQARPAQSEGASARSAQSSLQTTRPGRGETAPARPAKAKEAASRPAKAEMASTRPAKAEAAASRPRRSRRGEASPHAFKQHEAVLETGDRKRHSKLKTFLIVVPIVVVFAVAGVLGFNLISPLFDEEEIEPGIAVTVVIPTDVSTASQIANILKDAKVISDVQGFIADCRSMNAEGLLKPGTYELETLMDTTMLINYLVAGPVTNGVRLTIPEGLTLEQTAAIVENVCGIKQEDFIGRAFSADQYVKDYPFLQGVYNNSLEGFLYPKTYNIPNGANADYVIRVLLDQFVIETKSLNLAYAESCGLDFYHVVIMASLIEKETFSDTERPLVASVIYNRMRAGMMLQICATVVYALGPSYDGHALLYSDLEIDSPYNTYLIHELPVGPICSPSILSIQAAAQPAETNYYYYVLASPEGYHTFCETSEEFEIAKAEYNLIFGVQ